MNSYLFGCKESKSSEKSLLDLPYEVIVKIIKCCSYKSISCLNKTCTILRDISKEDHVWKYLCFMDYGVINLGNNFSSFGELYKSFLCRYGMLMGTYMLGLNTLGGLAEITYENGLSVCQWKQDILSFDRTLKRISLFKIEKHPENGCIKITCCRSEQPHEAKILKVNHRIFALKCENAKLHRNTPDDETVDFLSEMFYDMQALEGLTFLPLRIPLKCDVPDDLLTENGSILQPLIQPGLFRELNSALNPTFVSFQYASESSLIGFTIAASDRYTATGKTIKVNLKRSFCLTREEQLSAEALCNFSSEIKQHHDFEHLVEHDFVLLLQVQASAYIKDKIHRCKGRFLGFGKIPGQSFINIHFIIFNADTVGVLWLSQSKFTLYERVTRQFQPIRGGGIPINY